MELRDHLLYIDVTNVCNHGCKHCMYKSKKNAKDPKNMKLNPFAEENLSRLINKPETNHIIISGEGEPFNNEKAIQQILRLSKGNRYFQIITNGAWANKDLEEKIGEYEDIAGTFGDRYSFRISIDSFHIGKINPEVYLRFLRIATQHRRGHVSLAIRSLLEEKAFIRRFVSELLNRANIPYKIEEDNCLDDEIFLPNNQVNLTYKNSVFPERAGIVKPFSIENYIFALEQKYQKVFTLGNLRTNGSHKGLDLTIKPDGKVLFYGHEVKSYGNIFSEEQNTNFFIERVQKDPLLRGLYTIPFMEILRRLSENPEIKKGIREINNPYWIIKLLYPKYRAQIESAIGLK